MRIDLHIHTYFSDGSLSPRDVVKFAKTRGLKAISICDHDSVEGLQEAKEAAKEANIEFVPGIELTTSLAGGEIHILGYYIDSLNPFLKDVLRRAAQEKEARLRQSIDLLKKQGIGIEYEELSSPTGSLGRIHLIQHLLKKGFIRHYEEGYGKLLGVGCPGYVEPFRFPPAEAIDTIKNAGGISILAHPGGFDINTNAVREQEIERFIRYGLDGLEVYSYFHDPEKTRYFTSLAKKHKLLATGGSDCHGPLFGQIQIGSIPIDYSLLEGLKDFVEAKRGKKQKHRKAP